MKNRPQFPINPPASKVKIELQKEIDFSRRVLDKKMIIHKSTLQKIMVEFLYSIP